MNGYFRLRRRQLLGLAALLPLLPRAAGASDGIEQPGTPGADAFTERAFELRRAAVDSGDQPYGAVVVRDGIIVGQAASAVVTRSDPTAHAEMEAIRDAARRLGSRNLSGCILYSSSRACPMCEAAAYWAGIDRMVYGRDSRDAGNPALCGA